MENGTDKFESVELLFFLGVIKVANNIISSINVDLDVDITGEQFGKGQLGALLVLRRFGPMPISHIGEKLIIARPNMTAIIDALEHRGLVNRSASASDRRVTNIELTDSGREYIDNVALKIDAALNRKISVLTDEEREMFFKSVKFLTSICGKILEAKDTSGVNLDLGE